MQPKSSKRRRKEKKASSPPFIKPCLLSLFLFLGSVAEITKPNCKAQDKKKPKKGLGRKVPPLYVACALLFCLPAVKKSCKKKIIKIINVVPCSSPSRRLLPPDGERSIHHHHRLPQTILLQRILLLPLHHHHHQVRRRGSHRRQLVQARR